MEADWVRDCTQSNSAPCRERWPAAADRSRRSISRPVRAYLVPMTSRAAAVLIALHLSLVSAIRLLRECIGLLHVGFDAREAGVFPQDQQVPPAAVVHRSEESYATSGIRL